MSLFSKYDLLRRHSIINGGSLEEFRQQVLFQFLHLIFLHIFCFFFFFAWKLLLGGNTETSPGRRRDLNYHFVICHWNLNSISAHDFAKVQLLKAYLPVHKFDIVLKHTRALVFLSMMTTWTYQAISWSGQIIQPIVNVEVYVRILKAVYH